MPDFDRWLTTDPTDREQCAEHDAYQPCPLCHFQREMERWESGQEER